MDGVDNKTVCIIGVHMAGEEQKMFLCQNTY